MFTVEYSATHRGSRGRIVTDTGFTQADTLLAACRAGETVWARVGKRRGTTLQVRITAPGGDEITRHYRRD